MATIKFFDEMANASNVGNDDKMMIGKANTGETQVVSFDQVKSFLTIEGQRLAPTPPGALAAGPSGQTRYMEVKTAGTWTWSGNNFVNPEASIMTLWWDGSNWSKVEEVEMPLPEGVDVINPEGEELTKEKAVAGYTLFDKRYFDNEGYINKNNGNRDVTTSGYQYRSTHFLKIQDRENLRITGFSGASNNVALVAFYDEDLRFISYYNSTTTSNVTNLLIPSSEVPNNAFFIKASRLANSPGAVDGVHLDGTMVTMLNDNLENSILFISHGHINKGNGGADFSSMSTYSHTKYLRIIDRANLKITSGFSGASNLVALVAFYDRDLRYLSHYNAPTHGFVSNLTVPEVSIPSEAVYARFTCETTRLPSYIYGVDRKGSLRNDFVQDVIDDYRNGRPEDLLKTGYISKTTGYPKASSNYRYTDFYKLRLANHPLVLKQGFSGASNNVALVAFYNANLEYIGHYNPETAGAVSNVEVPTSSIPSNAKFVRFSLAAGQYINVKGAIIHKVTLLDVEKRLDIFNNEIFKLSSEDLYNNIGYINKLNGQPWDTNSSSYRHSDFLKIQDRDNLRVTGFSGANNNAALVAFYAANSEFIGFYNLETQGNVTNTQIPISSIPENAVYVRFTRFQSQSAHFSGVNINYNPKLLLDIISSVREIPSTTSILPERSSKPNPDNGGHLKLLNYLGNDQNIHPKVIYFESPWNGYRYWMAYTPYPSGNVLHENPCIAVSSDGQSWFTPDGLSNPLEFAPRDIENPNGYNSDTHLVFNSDTNKIECWWRSYNPTTNQDCIKRRVSANGVEFEPTEIVFDYGSAGMLSPAVIYENEKYKLWFCSGGEVLYKETIGSNINDWTANLTIPINFNTFGLHAWHMDVIRTPKGLEFVVQAWEIGIGNNNTSDLYYVLFDGETYSAPRLIVERGDLPTDKDYMGIYRASIVWHPYNSTTPRQGGYYFIYYSALGRNYANRNIFLTAGRSVDRLRGVNL